MLTAGAIMTPTLVTVRPDASIEEAIDLLLREQISGLPVLDDDDRLVGVITEFALLAVAYDRRVKNHTVSQHMTRELITVNVNDPVSRVVLSATADEAALDRLVELLKQRGLMNAAAWIEDQQARTGPRPVLDRSESAVLDGLAVDYKVEATSGDPASAVVTVLVRP